MKTILVTLTFVFGLFILSKGQTNNNQLTPTYYLNTEQIDMGNVYINPSNIDSVRVNKKTKGGEIYITTKQSLTFLTLDMILKTHGDNINSASQVVYIIDDKMVTDKSKVKIDDSFFIKLEIKRLDKVSYINEEYKNLILADIQLLDEKPEPTIRIRGDKMAQTGN